MRPGIAIAILFVSLSGISVTASPSGGSTGLFEQPVDPADLPAFAGGISTSSSSSFSDGEEEDTGADMGGESDITAGNRCSLLQNQSSIHMVVFDHEGTLSVTSLSGTGVEVFSQKGGDWPVNKTLRSDYGESDLVTASTPLTLDITPGTWYFTVFPLGDHASYELSSRLKNGSTSGSGTKTAPSASFSSSSGVASFSLG